MSLFANTSGEVKGAVTEVAFAGHALACYRLIPGEEGRTDCTCGPLSGSPEDPQSHPGKSCPVARFYAALGALSRALGVLAVAAAVALSCGAQTPTKTIKKVDWALLAADASVRTLDAYSTRKMLTDPCGCNREVFLPPAITNHMTSMLAYEGISFASIYYVSRYLRTHNHRKLARLVILADVVQISPLAVRNLFLGGESTSGRRRLLPLSEVR